MIPYGRQDVSEEDIREVVDVLRSDWITQGPAVENFEAAVAAYCNVPYAVAVSSGTAALHLACRALGLGPGDILWTSTNTFVASANCALYCGASVDFVDIDPRTYALSVESLETKLRDAQRRGALPKVVVPVHFAGQSCQMSEIRTLSEQYGFKIIEDAAHAIGGSYRNERIGNCKFSDLTVFSFHPVKVITTGEGGMVVTRDRLLYQQLMLLRSHGVTRDANGMTRKPEGSWYYEQVDLGYNYRITDIQAALGVSQMRRIEAFVRRRRELAQRYDRALQQLPVICPWQHPDVASAYHLYPIRIDPTRCQSSRARVFGAMRAAGIGVNVHYIPVHTQPYYQRLGFRPGTFPQAEKYYEQCMSLPLFATLSEADQDRVIRSLGEALG